MSRNKLVAVVIPVHEATPDANETLVLGYYLKLFAQYPIVFVTQSDLDTGFYEQMIHESSHPNCSFERFEYKGYDEYMHLLVSEAFYARFLEYEYMLMTHLDAFVFNADLEHWCKLNYDYIGAVVYHKTYVREYVASSRILQTLHKFRLLRKHPLQKGGLSLRKVRTFYRNSRLFKPVIRLTDIFYTEDFFWSVRVPLLNPFFRVAPTKVARHFAIELPDARSKDFDPFVNRLYHLPMGCHGWKVYGYTFWKSFLETFMHKHLVDTGKED
ncbi:DUF5672 family protein [Xanthocytophaga flava]|uniref:DUF5672 family protein n=1 Tax=Xanthocytophaga flava TaxID=3048013 RepID=UPI0028D0D136|nr:DUF5672 family protein [Xanthocytophaga flavus]MDJ1467998.1 DUF5672 family protein [Xanthocytophaga flavus]